MAGNFRTAWLFSPRAVHGVDTYTLCWLLILLKNDPFETVHGAEFASRERVVRRNTSHQGELMYLAGACDAAGGLPGFNLPRAAFCGGISRLLGREVRPSL